MEIHERQPTGGPTGRVRSPSDIDVHARLPTEARFVYAQPATITPYNLLIPKVLALSVQYVFRLADW